MAVKVSKAEEKLKYEAYLKTGIYFVTAIAPRLAKNSGGVYKLFYGGKRPTDSRCWGWYKKKTEAVKAVEENHCDLFECLYTHVVIEKVPNGILPLDVEEVQWFKWTPDPRCLKLKSWSIEGEGYGSSKYEKCEKPEWSGEIINWSIG